MCAVASVSLLLQKMIVKGYLSWDTTGWLLQSVSSTTYTRPKLEHHQG